MSDDGCDEIYAASCTVPFATDQNKRDSHKRLQTMKIKYGPSYVKNQSTATRKFLAIIRDCVTRKSLNCNFRLVD